VYSSIKYCVTIRCLAPILVLLVASCAPVGPDFVKPELDAPEEWSQPVSEDLETAPAELVEWWRVFNDPVLNELVAAALRDNNNLVESFPSNIIAGTFKFTQAEFFEIELVSKRNAPDVDL